MDDALVVVARSHPDVGYRVRTDLRTRSGPDGSFDLGGLDAGTWVPLVCGTDPYYDQCDLDPVPLPLPRAAVTVSTGEHVTNLEAPAIRAAIVRGTVRDVVSGEPIAGITVEALGGSDETDADGTYRIARIHPGVPFEVMAHDRLDPMRYGRVWWPANPFETAEHATVTGEPGEVVVKDFSLHPPTAQISGRVVDVAGRPLPDVHVSTYSSGFGSASATTDADGRYRLVDLAGGEHVVSFRKEGLHATSWIGDADGAFRLDQGVVASVDDIVMAPDESTERTALLRIRIDGEHAAEEIAVWRWVNGGWYGYDGVSSPERVTDLRVAEGRYLVAEVRDGLMTYFPRAVGPDDAEPVRVTGPEPVTVTLRPYEPARIGGLIRDIDGAPFASRAVLIRPPAAACPRPGPPRAWTGSTSADRSSRARTGSPGRATRAMPGRPSPRRSPISRR